MNLVDVVIVAFAAGVAAGGLVMGWVVESGPLDVSVSVGVLRGRPLGDGEVRTPPEAGPADVLPLYHHRKRLD